MDKPPLSRKLSGTGLFITEFNRHRHFEFAERRENRPQCGQQ